jgi:hypothetical protein
MKIKTALFLCFFWLILSCAKDKTPEPTDAQLVKLVFETTSFRYYQDNDSLYAKTSGSGHNFPFLKTKYNTIAASQLDSEGNLLSNATYSRGIVYCKRIIQRLNDYRCVCSNVQKLRKC